jgi:hypothetical protein
LAKIDKTIVEFVEDGNYAHTPQAVNEIIKDEIILVVSVQNHDMEAVSSNFVRKTKHRLGLIEVPAQLTTKARAEAEQDRRNLLSFAVLVAAIASAEICSAFVLNADATQFNVGGQSSKRLTKMMKKESTRKNKRVVTSKDTTQNQTVYYIKYYHLISADGVAGPPVYILAEEYMPTDDIDVYEQRTLAAGGAQHGTAYVAFMESWVPNKEFYRWFS